MPNSKRIKHIISLHLPVYSLDTLVFLHVCDTQKSQELLRSVYNRGVFFNSLVTWFHSISSSKLTHTLRPQLNLHSRPEVGVSQCRKYFCKDDINQNFAVKQISTSGTAKYPLSECKFTCGQSESVGFLELKT